MPKSAPIKAVSKAKSKESSEKRSRVSQADVPRHSLREALTVAQALTDNFAGKPTAPHQLAMALEISPTSSSWRSLTGAAVAYGLTLGGYNADKISLTTLGQRCTAPLAEGDDTKAKAEASLKPTVFAQFFGKYNRAKFPADHIAANVLQHEFSVPNDRAKDVLEVLKDNGAFVGVIHQTKTGPFVSTDDLSPSPVVLAPEPDPGELAAEPNISAAGREVADAAPAPERNAAVETTVQRPNQFRVFITHGKNMKLVEQVKDVLDLYDIEYEIAVEEETTAIPVPQKVLGAMRRCSAGIMIVSADNAEDGAQSSINNNVLIEIGAAFVLYDQRVVLLWDTRLKVPSNLQGLYRCEIDGDQLSFASGTRLAKAVKGFRQ